MEKLHGELIMCVIIDFKISWTQTLLYDSLTIPRIRFSDQPNINSKKKKQTLVVSTDFNPNANREWGG